MTAPVDDARDVREEDALDVAAVDGWLRKRLPDLPGGGPPELRQFAGGASNLTYLLRYPGRDLVLRRPPAGRVAASAHDVRREHRVVERLRDAYPYVPRPVALCEDLEVVGTPFSVVERLEGTILRRDVPRWVTLDPATARRLADAYVDRLVDLHAVDPAAAGLADLDRGPGYLARQVAGWSERYRVARTWNVPRFERVMRWLDASTPADLPHVVLHNDFRFDNLVLDPADLPVVRGVLDWEMATVGDPLADLGSALAYWVQADDGKGFSLLRRQPTHLPGMPTRAEVVRRYTERSGRDVDAWTFYEVYGLFRLAAVVQQIYQRYATGQTRNPQFRAFWLGVHVLHRRCTRLLRTAG